MKYKKEFIKGDGRKLIAGGPRDQQRRQRDVSVRSIDQTDLINNLREELKNLTRDLITKKETVKGFTGEQVDEEVRKAVSATIDEMKQSHAKDINQYESAITAYRNNESRLLEQIKNIEVVNVKLESEIDTYKIKLSENDKIIELFKNEKDSISNQNEKLTDLLEKQNKKLEDLSMSMASIHDTNIEITDDERPQMESSFIDPLSKDAGKELESHIEYENIKLEDNDGETKSKIDRLRSLMGKLPVGK